MVKPTLEDESSNSKKYETATRNRQQKQPVAAIAQRADRATMPLSAFWGPVKIFVWLKILRDYFQKSVRKRNRLATESIVTGPEWILRPFVLENERARRPFVLPVIRR